MRTSLTTGARRPLRTALAAVLSGLVWVSMAVVPAAAAGENTLATLSITGLSLDPAFASDDFLYLADDVAATASNGKYPITISATATDPTTGTNQAKVQYSLDGGSTWLPSSSPSRVLSASASLDLGSQEIQIRVDPSSGSDEIYYVGVDVYDGRNKLTALSFSGSGCSTFTTAFNSSTLDYEVAAVCSPSQSNDDVSVAFTAQSTNADVYWELNDSDSVQWLDDTDVALATSPIDVDLFGGTADAIQGFYPNEIKLSVIPESWTAADLVEPADYTITFYWKGTDTYANLNDLDLSVGSHVPLSPAFDPAEVNYTAGPVSATSVVVIPDRGDVGQGVEVRSNGGTWTTIENEESASVSLTSGTNTINVRVTATDRATTKTYTITLTTSGTGTAVLSGLLISAGTLSPAFASGTLNYTASVPSATSSIDVTATGAGTLTRTVNGGTESSVTSGVSFNVTLTDNAVTTIRVKVTNGAANATYAIAVTRGTANPTLATLSLGTACTLAPAFTPNTPAPTTPYACTVLATTTSVSVSATPTTVGDTVQWRIGTGDFGTAASLTLAAGVNNVEVKVTRSGGGGGGSSSSTYKVTVTKPGAPGLTALSLTANGKAVALTPAFAAATLAYEAKVLGTSVLVSFTKSDPNATVKAIFDSSQVAVTGSSLTVPLDAGKNVITLEITPAGGGTPTSYVLEIRAPRCKVVNVVGLTLKEARAKLKQNNCLVRVQRESSSTVARNTVIRQDPVVSLNPKQNKRAPGFRVTLYVSKGP